MYRTGRPRPNIFFSVAAGGLQSCRLLPSLRIKGTAWYDYKNANTELSPHCK
ncbi:unnamed protein product [Chondrus crispus]|uniref:Uncharacterized protein n=1 Tax=Chondrus crispus TaxID=2769 RepID=R7QRU0_CHOCR|nr:unnamed protein product [Chondrus crispus]CDF40221.1 unnamed protein product [Chondrus crispus]|eukprot:XP_005710515.1 unnamed protein product [Chondrus crispus]